MSKQAFLPTPDNLNNFLAYDPNTGALTWRVNMGRAHAGDRIKISSEGYARVSLHGVRYRAHRIIWKMMTGKDAVGEIDHKDRNRSNNRWANLRETTESDQNINNRAVRSDSMSGIKGIYYEKSAHSWRATISVKGRKIYLGLYKTPQEANAAYWEAAKKHFGEYACNEGRGHTSG